MRSKTDFQANVVLKFDLFAIIVVAYIMERDMEGFASTKKVYYDLDILKFVMAFVVVSIHARLFEEVDSVFDSIFLLIILYPFMLSEVLEPIVRIFFVSILFMAFKNMNMSSKPYYVKMRKMSILVFVIHFFFNSGYFYLAEGKYPILNNSVLHFITILALSIIVSLVLLKLMNKPSFRWLKYGL